MQETFKEALNDTQLYLASPTTINNRWKATSKCKYNFVIMITKHSAGSLWKRLYLNLQEKRECWLYSTAP